MKGKPWSYITVFGWRIPVFKVPGLLSSGAYGTYDDHAKVISVDAGLRGDIQTHTLIHEMFHAVLDRLHCQPQMSDEFNEVLVENLTVALMENFKVRKK